MHYATKTGAALAAALLLALPATGRAQVERQFSVDLYAGVGIPLETLEDITDIGGAFGGTLAWHFHPNWAVRGDVDFIKLNEAEAEGGILIGPPIDMVYLGGGVEVNFGPPKYQDLPFTFAANLGAGAMMLKVDDTFNASHPAGAIDQSYLAFNGGARLGYRLTPYLNLFVQGQLYFILFDEADSLAWVSWANDQGLTGLDSFDTLWVLPITGGVRISF
ncbi:MAG: outer membrane beta-barrel protein [Gemmatimonadota bacterium]